MTSRGRTRVGALVLAAGASTRLGRPKQMIEHRGLTLLRRAIVAARGGGCCPVAVVIGARAPLMRREIASLDVRIVEHPGWEEGLGSSIACGMRALLRWADVPDAVMLLLCDQPHLSADVVRRLARAWRQASRSGSATRAACEYAGTLGPPAIFARGDFERLAELTGDEGAKRLLLGDEGRVARLAWEPGAIDLDRPDEGIPEGREL